MIRFSLAVAGVALLPQLPPGWLGIAGPLLGAACCYGIPRLRPLMPVCAGLLWGLLYGYWGMAHRLPEQWQGQDLLVAGTLTGLPRSEGSYCRFQLRVEHLEPPPASVARTPLVSLLGPQMPRNLRLGWYRCDGSLVPGQHITATVRLKRPRAFYNPGSYDADRRDFSQGVDGVGYLRSAPELTPARDRFSIDRWRWQLAGVIDGHIDNPEQGALVRAMLLGDKRGISEQQWQRYRETGTLHLLVISGLHIGLVSAACFALLFYLGRLLPRVSLTARLHLAVWAALAAALGYSLLAGFSLPTQRALVMVSVLLLGWLWQRDIGPLTRMKSALLAVLLLDPLAVMAPGFWLSFAAAGILIFQCYGRVAVPAAIVQLPRLQLAILLFMSPLLAYHFAQVPWLSPLINLVAVPFVTLLLLPLAMGSLVMEALSPWLAAIGFEGTAWLLGLGDQFLRWCHGLAGAGWRPPPSDMIAVAVAMAGSLLLLLPAAVPARWLGMVCWLPLILGMRLSPGAPELRITVLDVGQGLAIYVATANHHLLYDTGRRYRSGFTLAKAVVIPFLASQGVERLDGLVVSHGDIDHAGGRELILQALRPRRYFSGDPSDRHPAMVPCREGIAWQWEGVHFSFLHPPVPEPPGVNDNNRSCVLRIESESGTVLLTGDIEADVEGQLAASQPQRLAADLLLVAHHGSKTSSSRLFLDRVKARVAVVSSGYRNRFGHPHPAVVSRIRSRGTALYDTAQSGALTIHFDRGEMQLHSRFRIDHSRYWWH